MSLPAKRFRFWYLDIGRLITAVLGGGLVFELLLPWHIVLHTREATGYSPDLLPTSKVKILDARLIDDKPLFATDRKPWAPPPAKAPPTRVAPTTTTDELAGYHLTGTVISPNERMALLWSQVRGVTLRLQLNQSLEGWTVSSIRPNGVAFVNNGQTLEMRFHRNPVTPARQEIIPWGLSPSSSVATH